MATLYIRNVPDDIYSLLRETARQDHRSLNAEVLYLLDCALTENEKSSKQTDLLKRVRERRARYRLSAGAPDSIDLLRADRER